MQKEPARVCPSPQQLGPHQQEQAGGQQAPCPGWVQQQIRLQTAGNSTSEHQLVITTLQYNGEAGSSLAGQLTSAITKLGRRQNHDNSSQFCLLMPGGGRFVKKTSRKYNFPHTKNNLRHYFYFLPVRVSNILKF